MVNIDGVCLGVFIIILLTDIFMIVALLRFGGLPVSGFSIQKWFQLDPDYLKMTFESRNSWRIFDDMLSLLSSISLVALFLPIFQVSWILSHRGKRRIVHHISIFILALAGGLSELMASLMTVGARSAAHRINDVAQLDSWVSGDSELSVNGGIYYEDDGFGRRVFEIVYFMAVGLTTWVDAFEWLCLALIFTILYFEVRIEHKLLREGEITIDKNVAYLGLIIGIFGYFEFLSLVARVESWEVWSIISFFAYIINVCALLPAWLVLLGKNLPRIRASFENQHEAIPLRTDDISLESEDNSLGENVSFSDSDEDTDR